MRMNTSRVRCWRRFPVLTLTVGGLLLVTHRDIRAQEPPPLPVPIPASASSSFSLTILGQGVDIDPDTDRDALRAAIWKALPGAKASIDIPDQLDYIVPFSPDKPPGGMTFDFEEGRLTRVILSALDSGNPDVCPPIGALILWLEKVAGGSKETSLDRAWQRWEHGGWTFLLHHRTEGEDPDYTMIVNRDGGGPEIEGWEPSPSRGQTN